MTARAIPLELAELTIAEYLRGSDPDAVFDDAAVAAWLALKAASRSRFDAFVSRERPRNRAFFG